MHITLTKGLHLVDLAQMSRMGKPRVSGGEEQYPGAWILGGMVRWAMTVTILHKRREEITNQVFLIQVLCLFSSAF